MGTSGKLTLGVRKPEGCNMTSVYSFVIPNIFLFYGAYSCRDEAAVNCSVNKGGFVPALMLLHFRNITDQ